MADEFPLQVSRRQFALTASGALASAMFGDACGVATQSNGNHARLTARPRAGVTTTLESGALGLGGERDGLVQMPSIRPSGKVPLLVFLHGATQNGASMIRRIGVAADHVGIAVLAPDSRGTTWDAIRRDFAEDVVFLNRALESIFARVNVDPLRLAIGGFSDGASYGLSLGLANGDLFPRIVACSPGFIMHAPPQGKPDVFISHGISDQILPIDQCSRVIVPRLRTMGVDVAYKEFEGRHEMPPDLVGEALRWMTQA